MSSDGRRYSGYDEYEGIFSPLGSVRSRVTGRAAASSYVRSNPSRGFPGKRSAPYASNGYERRQRYLSERKSKRRVKPLDVDDIDDGIAPLATSAVASKELPQQIWLPTKNFSFRQRAGKLDTRTIARLDLQKIVATTDIATIQRHLEHLAFSDVTLEDVQHYSDSYFLKLFQIAQLTVEYLLNVQDSLASHCENLETQCEGLAEECASLEQENQKIDSDILALKKEVRQKQSTLATFEVMLLNATASKRGTKALQELRAQPHDQENDPVIANILGADANTPDEQGAVPLVSSCVLCGKKFVSPAYLVKHQQKKHADTAQLEPKRTKKESRHRASTSSSESDSASSDHRSSDHKKRRREPKPVALPQEITQAISQSNELTKQLMELQSQLQHEKAKRAEDTKHHEQQQVLLATQLASYMAKLQDTLVAMERKQEQSKHEMMRYTQETIERVKSDEVAARKQRSRAGRLESDDEDDGATKTRPSGSAPVDQRLLESLLRTQAEVQSKNSELEQANRKLQSKLRRRVRGEPSVSSSSLMVMAALDAQRFGVDVGIIPEVSTPTPPPPKAVVEDKLVQTDEEREVPRPQRAPTLSQSIQTELAEATPTVPEPKKEPPPQPKRSEAKAPKSPPAPAKQAPIAKPVELNVEKPVAAEPKPVVPTAPRQDTKPESKLQHAAHVVGKVALGFLARKALQNPSNWLLTLPAASLPRALTADELAQLTDSQGRLQDVTVEIEDGMTANDLRVAFADALGEHVDYHRVLLRHRTTGRELVGDRHVAPLRNAIDVEIIPAFDEAERHVDSVLESHADTGSLLQRIRRDSLEFAPGELPSARGVHTAAVASAVVRIQAVVRRFLAVRYVETLKIDRLVAARLLSMDRGAERRRGAPSRRLTRSASVIAITAETTDTRAVAKRAEEVHVQLADEVERATGVVSKTRSAKWSRGQLSSEAYERHVEELRSRQRALPPSVQQRIAEIAARVEQLVADEYDAELAKKAENEYVAASRIQLALQVGVARKKLRALLGRSGGSEKNEEEEMDVEKEAASRESTNDSDVGEATKEEEVDTPPQEEEDSNEAVDVEELDATEIKRLADDYERSAEAKTAVSRTPTPEPVAKPVPTPVTRPGTPPPGRGDDMGRSPRPKDDNLVISPFSKTPLLSRRSAAMTRRGSGFDNAR